jgi:hypothetical protein
LLGAGLFGRATGRTEATAAAEVPVPGAAPAEPSTIELRFYGRSWRLQGDGPRAGWAIPTRGQRSLVYGELLDAPANAGGSKVGELYATCTCVSSPFGTGPLSATSLEQHTLTLLDGTLTGMGTSQGDDGSFAIVGGTGRYTGARGSYTARQSPTERGGDGSADIVVTLILDGRAGPASTVAGA